MLQVLCWDTTSNGPDEAETDGHTYISAHSEELTGDNCARKDMGEGRIYIVDSEMGYLGYHDSKSYGLTWEVCSKKTT